MGIGIDPDRRIGRHCGYELLLATEPDFMAIFGEWKSNESKVRRRIRKMKPLVESMESRELLSHVVAPHPTIAEHRALVQERVQQARQRVHAYNAEHVNDPQTITNGITFTKNTVDTGKKLATSGNALELAAGFAKRSIAKDTLKVGWEYFKNVITGNGKALRQLPHTQLVQQVGHEYTQVAHSHNTKKVGESFRSFGKAVTGAYHKVF